MKKETAIKIVKNNWPEGRLTLQEALQTLIPELKGIEDERIRKELIEFLDNNMLDVDERHYRWIAWLEKQGEQKPAWSEDERTRKNCIHFLELQKEHHAATFEIEECINWLKSLKDRVVPQDEQIENDNETNQQKGSEK